MSLKKWLQFNGLEIALYVIVLVACSALLSRRQNCVQFKLSYSLLIIGTREGTVETGDGFFVVPVLFAPAAVRHSES